mmetsp:Transcript_57840/g.95561  ORF Transcript_57840/g.95561 Transcript_57840/m.95561 type:complete len:192 (-) Transcript_57840:36-611(-)
MRLLILYLIVYMSEAANAGFIHAVRQLHRESWQEEVEGREWIILFTIQGCTHCSRAMSLWNQLATQLVSDSMLQVGHVDCTKENGISRSFSVQRFPTILRISRDEVFEYTGSRQAHMLLEFARGGFKQYTSYMRHPTVLLANTSDLWLLVEALWDPFKTALGWSVGLAVGLKGVAHLCLRLTRPNTHKKGD